MRLRPWFLASIGLNLILLAAWYIADLQEEKPIPVGRERLAMIARKTSTNVLVRRINITWTDIQSTNLADYITRLQAAGCPAPTIRDIILAEVNQVYGRRRALEVVTPDQQWWKSDPDPGVARAAAAQLRDLETQRRATLTDLLGENWETDTDVRAWLDSNYGLTGPQLGGLPPEVKRAVYDIATRAEEEAKGQNPMEAARIRQDERAELQTLLAPGPLTEYLLRYSQTAQRLREQTRGVSFSPDQFQSLFASVDPIASDPEYYYQGNDAELLQRQRALQDQYEAALRQGVGEEAYAALQLNQNPLYISAWTAAQQSGLPAQSIMPLYQINRATQAELPRIRNDPTLSDEEKIAALASTRVEQQKSVEQLLGAEAFQRWLQTQTKP